MNMNDSFYQAADVQVLEVFSLCFLHWAVFLHYTNLVTLLKFIFRRRSAELI